MKKALLGFLLLGVLSLTVLRGAEKEKAAQTKPQTYEKEYQLIAQEKAAREVLKLAQEKYHEEYRNLETVIHNADGTVTRVENKPSEQLTQLFNEYNTAQDNQEKATAELRQAQITEYNRWQANIKQLKNPFKEKTHQEWVAAEKSNNKPLVNILYLKYLLEQTDYLIKCSNPNPLLQNYMIRFNVFHNYIQEQLNDIRASIPKLQTALNAVIPKD